MPDISAEAVDAAAIREATLAGLDWTVVPDKARAFRRSEMRIVLAAALPHLRERWLAEEDREPEPCPLDHSCDEGELCGCWCQLHDCVIDECPTFLWVEKLVAGFRIPQRGPTACEERPRRRARQGAGRGRGGAAGRALVRGASTRWRVPRGRRLPARCARRGCGWGGLMGRHPLTVLEELRLMPRWYWIAMSVLMVGLLVYGLVR